VRERQVVVVNDPRNIASFEDKCYRCVELDRKVSLKMRKASELVRKGGSESEKGRGREVFRGLLYSAAVRPLKILIVDPLINNASPRLYLSKDQVRIMRETARGEGGWGGGRMGPTWRWRRDRNRLPDYA
jgi:hypothetical protein